MLPTIEDYRRSCARWRGVHRGTDYEVSHHGVSQFMPSGIWCSYVTFREEMFQRADDWALFDIKPEIVESFGQKREHLDYNALPDLPWHGGATFGLRCDYVARDGRRVGAVKAGCDYGHLWDGERGYPYSLADIEQGAKLVIDALHDQFPQNDRCGYSGRIAHPSEFYTAKNGARVHASQQADIRASGWFGWLPAQVAEATQ